MIQTLGSHSQTGLSGVTDGEWVHFDILKAGEDGGDDRYRLLRDLTRPPRSTPFNAPRPTLPPADKVSNLVADGLSQALSSESIDHSTESRDLEAVDFGEEVTVEDRWVEVDRLPERAWKTVLGQAMDVLRSAVKERTTFNETAAELKDTSISSLSELANAYADFFKSGIVSYDKKKQPTKNGKIQRTLIVRVKEWTDGGPGNGGGDRPPGSGAQEITFVARSQEAAQEIFQGILPDATLLSSKGLSFSVLVEGNALQVVTRLRESGLATSVNGAKVEGVAMAGISAAPVAAAGIASIIGYFASQ